MNPMRKMLWLGLLLWVSTLQATPTVPWTFLKTLDWSKTYVVQLTYFKVPRERMDRARLLMLIQGVTKQLVASPGLVAFSFHEDEPTAQYWTLSIWENEETVRDFTYAPRTPHARVMMMMKDAVERSGFVRWEIRRFENATVSWRTLTEAAPCGALLEVGPPSQIE